MPEKPIVVVFGGINMDLVGATGRMPSPGETVFGSSFHTTPGGKGANQAVAAARLGAEVRMVGRVGKDTFGSSLIDGLAKEGINVSGISIDPHNASGIAIILLDSDKQNYIVAIYGANLACDETQLKALDLALVGADVLMLQMEIPLDVSIRAARQANALGVKVVWDPAPAIKLPPEAYSLCSVLTPNQTEAEFLTGIKVSDFSSAELAANDLISIGTPAVVVTMGSQGVFYASNDGRGTIPSFEVSVKDTVAAGDAFAAAVGFALGRGNCFKESVQFGCAAGALAVTRLGAQEAMPSRYDVDKVFNLSN